MSRHLPHGMKAWVKNYWAVYDKCSRCGALERMCCRITHVLTNHKRPARRACPGRPKLSVEEKDAGQV